MDLAAALESLRAAGVAQLAAASDAAALEEARIAVLGRQGRLKELQTIFKDAAPEVKRACGKLLREVDEALQEAHRARQEALSGATSLPPLDITLPVANHRRGSLHPISQVARAVEQVFTSMGYEVVDGPHIEEDEFNFSRLNIPADHPARDAQDTFWLDTGRLLRTHTSAVQSRTYRKGQPPLRKVVVGKVFRYEEVDATHDNTFTQVEGFLVDRGITVAHLVGTLDTMLKAVLGREDIEIRLRPSFFPFVEPGFEVDVRVTAPDAGRLGKWVELLGCGMIHPQVLQRGGIDPAAWSGFAFGLGLERLAMIRHGITDIRLFHGGDLRALRQFAS